MGIISAGATDIGRKRKTNQDSICLDSTYNFFAVADGMGGHNCGDIASQLSVQIIPEYLKVNAKLEPETLMRELIHTINTTILAKAQSTPDLHGMGTTISAIHFAGPQLFVGNVGDSRVYMINNQHIYQLTRDHSFVQEKLNMGIYTREEASRDPQKNVLVRSVGFDPEVLVDVFQYRICKNDLFLICSDGLHGKVSDADILHIVKQNIPNPAEATKDQLLDAVHELIRQANENGGQDNISVILAVAKA
jgi:protein phosphatase